MIAYTILFVNILQFLILDQYLIPKLDKAGCPVEPVMPVEPVRISDLFFSGKRANGQQAQPF
jgi:hypothetical protein